VAVGGGDGLVGGVGDDAEIGASAAHSPPKIRVGKRANINRLPGGGNYPEGQYIIDGHTQFADKVTITTAEAGAECADAIAIANLDEYTGRISSGDHVGYNGTAADA
ncbi:hypothetical protein MCOR10_011826, partial [Pyricularia oryzae]